LKTGFWKVLKKVALNFDLQVSITEHVYKNLLPAVLFQYLLSLNGWNPFCVWLFALNDCA